MPKYNKEKNNTREHNRLSILLTTYKGNACKEKESTEKNMILYVIFLQNTLVKTRKIPF